MNNYPEHIQEKIKELNLIGYTKEEIFRLAFNECSNLMVELTKESNWNQGIKRNIAQVQEILLKEILKK